MLRKKLKQQKAETLVETLAALLIATLSVMMLTSAITAGARINAKNREADEKMAAQMKAAEGRENSLGEKTLQLKVSEATPKEITVILYGKSDGKLAAYEIKEVAAP